MPAHPAQRRSLLEVSSNSLRAMWAGGPLRNEESAVLLSGSAFSYESEAPRTADGGRQYRSMNMSIEQWTGDVEQSSHEWHYLPYAVLSAPR